jgi:DNA-binding transcriptional ArsR family regulator
MNEKPTIADEHIIENLDTLKIIADPTRLEVMRTLKKPRTVKEVSELMDTDPTKLYYHVRQLEKPGHIRVVETNIVSGIIEKTYQVVARRFRVEESLIAATEMTDENMEKLFGTIFEVTKAEIKRSVQVGLMDLADNSEPQRHGVGQGSFYLTEAQAAVFYQKVEAIMKEYEEEAGDKQDDPTRTPYGFLFAFYPLHRPE